MFQIKNKVRYTSQVTEDGIDAFVSQWINIYTTHDTAKTSAASYEAKHLKVIHKLWGPEKLCQTFFFIDVHDTKQNRELNSACKRKVGIG